MRRVELATPKMLSAIPVLLSLDIPAAVQFYATTLGFNRPNAKLADTDYGTREFGVIDAQRVLITFYERR